MVTKKKRKIAVLHSWSGAWGGRGETTEYQKGGTACTERTKRKVAKRKRFVFGGSHETAATACDETKQQNPKKGGGGSLGKTLNRP